MLWWKGFVLYFSTNKPGLYFIQNNEQKGKNVSVENQPRDKASGLIISGCCPKVAIVNNAKIRLTLNLSDGVMKWWRTEDGGGSGFPALIHWQHKLWPHFLSVRKLPDVTEEDFSKVDLRQFKWIHWEVNKAPNSKNWNNQTNLSSPPNQTNFNNQPDQPTQPD